MIFFNWISLDKDHNTDPNKIEIDLECLGFSLRNPYSRNVEPQICSPRRLEPSRMERQIALYRDSTSILDVFFHQSNLEALHLDPGHNPN